MITAPIKKTALLLTVLAGFGLMTAGAYAEKGGKDKGRGSDDHYSEKYEDSHGDNHGRGGHGHDDHYEGRDDDKVWIRIGDDDRRTISKYLDDDLRRNCPPGLAKKNNGCLPPGIAKKYAIGQRLPDDVSWSPISDELRKLLKPAPGYEYVQVDKDILLIGEATKKVIDAVTLISAVGE